MTCEQADAAHPARSDVDESNMAWRTAEPVRPDWLRALDARKTAPLGSAVFLSARIALRPEAKQHRVNQLAADLLACPQADYGRSGDSAAFLDAAADARVQPSSPSPATNLFPTCTPDSSRAPTSTATSPSWPAAATHCPQSSAGPPDSTPPTDLADAGPYASGRRSGREGIVAGTSGLPGGSSSSWR